VKVPGIFVSGARVGPVSVSCRVLVRSTHTLREEKKGRVPQLEDFDTPILAHATRTGVSFF
jgi:hypothetical protein